MTTHDEAFLLGVMTRLTDFTSSEVREMGDSLNDYAMANVEQLNDEQKAGITYLINHCLEIMEMTQVIEDFIETKLQEFAKEHGASALFGLKKKLNESEISDQMNAVQEKTLKDRVMEVAVKLAAEAIHKNNTNLN